MSLATILRDTAILHKEISFLPMPLRKKAMGLIEGSQWSQRQRWEDLMEAKKLLEAQMAKVIQES